MLLLLFISIRETNFHKLSTVTPRQIHHSFTVGICATKSLNAKGAETAEKACRKTGDTVKLVQERNEETTSCGPEGSSKPAAGGRLFLSLLPPTRMISLRSPRPLR